MPTQSLTIHVPIPLYQHLKQRAEEAQRSVEEEALEVLTTAIPAEGTLPAELNESLASLDALDDGALWEAARTRLADEVAEQLESLHAKKRRERLSAAESERLAQLLYEYERSMLTRAKAATLLRERGHDISGLFAS